MKLQTAKIAGNLVDAILEAEQDLQMFEDQKFDNSQDVTIHEGPQHHYLISVEALDIKNLIINRKNNLEKRLAKLK